MSKKCYYRYYKHLKRLICWNIFMSHEFSPIKHLRKAMKSCHGKNDFTKEQTILIFFKAIVE